MMRPTDCYEPLHRNGQGHVGGGTEGHRRHAVQDIHIHLGHELRDREPMVDDSKSSVSMYGHIEDDVSK